MTDVLRIAVPLTLWLAGFSAVYGLQGLVCSSRWPEGGPGPRAVLLAAAAAAVALQICLLLALRSPRYGSPSPFARRLSVTLAVAAVVAAVWTLVPVATTSICL